MAHGSSFARGVLAAILMFSAAVGTAQDIELSAPQEATVGGSLEVRWQGSGAPQDFITIVPSNTPAGKYEAYQYARQSPVTLEVPGNPGDYEIRYLAAASPYTTLASRPLAVLDSPATLEPAASVAAGGTLSVTWQGPDNARDFITLVPAGTPEGQYGVYTYTNKGSPLSLRRPIRQANMNCATCWAPRDIARWAGGQSP